MRFNFFFHSVCHRPICAFRFFLLHIKSYKVLDVFIRHMLQTNAKVQFFIVCSLQSSADIPPLPVPPLPRPSVEELVAAGESVLDELGLFTWWKPTSYFRLAIEGMHNYFDMPYWATIMCGMLLTIVQLLVT